MLLRTPHSPYFFINLTLEAQEFAIFNCAWYHSIHPTFLYLRGKKEKHSSVAGIKPGPAALTASVQFSTAKPLGAKTHKLDIAFNGASLLHE